MASKFGWRVNCTLSEMRGSPAQPARNPDPFWLGE